GDRERQEGDRVDEPERDDRKGDRLEPELDPWHPLQCRDLDEVVQSEGKDHAAGRGGAARGQAAATAGTARDREKLLPAERAKDVAREVERSCASDEAQVGTLERPTRVCEPARKQDASPEREGCEGDGG